MKFSSILISIITGLLMFLVTFYTSNHSVIPSLFMGIVGLVTNIWIGIEAKKRLWALKW